MGVASSLQTFYFDLFVCLFVFGCAGSSLLRRLFSSGGQQGLLSSWSVRASYCTDFSCGARALGGAGFSNCGSQALEQRRSSCTQA